MTITTTSQIPAGDRLSEHYCSTCGDPFEAPFASMACQCEAEAEVVEEDDDEDDELCPETGDAHVYDDSDPTRSGRPSCGNCGAVAPEVER